MPLNVFSYSLTTTVTVNLMKIHQNTTFVIQFLKICSGGLHVLALFTVNMLAVYWEFYFKTLFINTIYFHIVMLQIT